MADLEMEKRFHAEMLEIYERGKTEVKYTATRFRQMVLAKGGVATARYLLESKPKDVSEGYVQLALAQRLDLSVEALALKDEWKSLFTDEQRKTAMMRLKTSNYGG